MKTSDSEANDILQKILAVKREEVAAALAAKSLAALRAEAAVQPPPRDFAGAIRAKVSLGKTAVIAEIKKAAAPAARTSFGFHSGGGSSIARAREG